MLSSARELTCRRNEDLRRRVVNYLFGHKMPSLRRIRVEADNGTVTLRGKVSTFYQRQLCINCCRRVAGVVQLVDRVEVVTPPAAEAKLV